MDSYIIGLVKVGKQLERIVSPLIMPCPVLIGGYQNRRCSYNPPTEDINVAKIRNMNQAILLNYRHIASNHLESGSHITNIFIRRIREHSSLSERIIQVPPNRILDTPVFSENESTAPKIIQQIGGDFPVVGFFQS